MHLLDDQLWRSLHCESEFKVKTPDFMTVARKQEPA